MPFFGFVVFLTIMTAITGAEWSVNPTNNSTNCFPYQFFLFDWIDNFRLAIAESKASYIVSEIAIIALFVNREKIIDYLAVLSEKNTKN